MMKVKFIGETCVVGLDNGFVYNVISVEKGWYRIVDKSGVYPDEKLPGYLYPPELFEIVEE